MTSRSRAPRLSRTLSIAFALLFGVLAALFWAAHSGQVASRSVPSSAQPSLARGEPQPASHVGLERAPGVVVASTPLLHRCPAVPAPWAGGTGARGWQRGTVALHPVTTDATVVRWRTHVPRMNDGDPPRSARFAS